MSSDYWLGMFTLPAAAWALFCLYSAGCAFIYYSERFNIRGWRIWPKRVEKYNRGNIAATVAFAKSVRYF